MRRFAPDELAEIRTLYRNAASPKKQIGILNTQNSKGVWHLRRYL